MFYSEPSIRRQAASYIWRLRVWLDISLRSDKSNWILLSGIIYYTFSSSATRMKNVFFWLYQSREQSTDKTLQWKDRNEIRYKIGIRGIWMEITPGNIVITFTGQMWGDVEQRFILPILKPYYHYHHYYYYYYFIINWNKIVLYWCLIIFI